MVALVVEEEEAVEMMCWGVGVIVTSEVCVTEEVENEDSGVASEV